MTNQAQNLLTQAVETAESFTNAELVVVGYARADAYLDIAFRNALFATLLTLATTFLSPMEIPHDVALPMISLISLATFLASRLPAIIRLTSSKSRRSHAIDTTVAHAFLSKGVHRTHDHTGLLIAFFELERSTQVVFDTGLESRIPDEVKTKIVQSLLQASTVRNHHALPDAVAALGKLLAPFIPKTADDLNELPDQATLEIPQ